MRAKRFIPYALLLLCLLLPLSLRAGEAIRISGTVVDKQREPLVGVTVMVQGTALGTITDLDGHFYLDVPSKQSKIEVSYVGYATQTIPVGSDINFFITMEEETEALDEVMVVGYGNQKKLSVIGSIQALEPKKLQVGSTRSMSNNLAGQLAGVIAVQPSGEPGYDNSDFWIRGIASFSGNTSPLVLVDGVERSLNDIDPAEIEAFSVLKDASASAMYGVRGANGVILINTKRGSVAPPSVSLRIEQSVSTPTQLPQFIGAAEYMDLLNSLQTDPNKRLFTKDQILKTYYGYDPDLYPDVDWVDAITNDVAYSTRANLNVSGGSERLRYALTGSYYHEKGIMATDETLSYDTGSKLNRFNLRANVDLDVTKTTLLRFNIGGNLQMLRKSNSSTDEVFAKAFETPPFVHPAVYSDGTIPIASANRYNPWAMCTQNGYYRSTSGKLESLFAIEQDLKFITPGLRAKATFSYDYYTRTYMTRGKTPDYYSVAKSRNDEGELVHSILSYGSEFLDHSNNAEYGNNSIYFEAALTYNRTFAKKHAVDALFLYNLRSYDNGDYQPYRTQGIAGRLSYTYDRRYIAEFNFGYNGSENFAKGHRYGFFPSGAIGWLISEEHWMEQARSVLTKLKLRGSIGLVGNDNIGGSRRFAYITTINHNANGYNWGYTGDVYYTGVQEGEIGVENLTWETSRKANVGFELGLYNDLDLQVDFFQELRSNIFMQRNTIPSQAGFISTPYANFGRVDNRGVDLSCTYSHRFRNGFNLSFRGTFTYARNTILEIDEPEAVKGTYRSQTGQSINTLWGYTADGLYTADDFDADGNLVEGLPIPQLGATVRPGDIKYVDKNGDGKITDEDQGYIGGTNSPRIVYGFGGNFEYKGFDFNLFFQGTGDTWRIIGGNDYFIPGSGQGVLGNVYTNYNDRWTESNPSQNVFWPRLSESTNTNNNVASTWWKKNMSFLRLKTIEVGYSLPQSVLEKMHAKKFRIAISGNNLFCFSSFKLWDPELDTNDGLRYPAMRSGMVSLEVGF